MIILFLFYYYFVFIIRQNTDSHYNAHCHNTIIFNGCPLPAEKKIKSKL